MRSGKSIVFVLLGLFFLISACQDEKKSNDYQGVSELIAERNRARYSTAAENKPKKKTSNQKKYTEKNIVKEPEPVSKQAELSSVILYEEQVKIIGSDSGRTLAKGVAYVNKKGQIVRIKILKE